MKASQVYKYVIQSIKKIGAKYTILEFLLTFISVLIPLSLSYVLRIVVNLISSNALIDDYYIVIIVIFCIFFIEQLVRFLLDYINHKMNLYNEYLNKRKNIDKLSKLKFEKYEDPYTYQLYSVANSGTNINPFGVVKRTSSFISSSFLFIASAVIILNYSLYILIFPIVFIILDCFLKRNMEKYNFEASYNREIIDINKRVNYYSSLNSVNYYLENHIYNTSKLFNEKLVDNNKKLMKLKNRFLFKNLRLSLIDMIFLVIIINVNYLIIANSVFLGEITIGDFTFYNSLIVSIFSVANKITDDYTFFTGHLRFDEMNIQFNNLPEREEAIVENNVFSKNYKKIEFRNVYFKYPNSEKYVLNNVSFVIDMDDTVAIIGKNGCGKTTLIKLLSGLYDIESGAILIDGINIKDISQTTLCNIINVMQQDLIKLSFSIKDYISLGRPFDEKLFIKCIKDSGFYDDYMKNNYTVNTILGKQFDKNGVELSTGQWQKLYLSRIIYNKKDINIMDEPTSSMDAISENKFLTNVCKIFDSRNVIFISHRLSIVHICNKIIYFDNQNVIIGTHEELYRSSKNYKNDYDTQKEMYILNN